MSISRIVMNVGPYWLSFHVHQLITPNSLTIHDLAVDRLTTAEPLGPEISAIAGFHLSK